MHLITKSTNLHVYCRSFYIYITLFIFHEKIFLRYWPRSTLICVNVDFRWHWILVGVDTGLLIYFTICFCILLVLAAEIEMPSICKLSITQLQLSGMMVSICLQQACARQYISGILSRHCLCSQWNVVVWLCFVSWNQTVQTWKYIMSF
jgi:hypothetical protein